MQTKARKYINLRIAYKRSGIIAITRTRRVASPQNEFVIDLIDPIIVVRILVIDATQETDRQGIVHQEIVQDLHVVIIVMIGWFDQMMNIFRMIFDFAKLKLSLKIHTDMVDAGHHHRTAGIRIGIDGVQFVKCNGPTTIEIDQIDDHVAEMTGEAVQLTEQERPLDRETDQIVELAIETSEKTATIERIERIETTETFGITDDEEAVRWKEQEIVHQVHKEKHQLHHEIIVQTAEQDGMTGNGVNERRNVKRSERKSENDQSRRDTV